ncbi:unnamed protein product [Kuraishia capsulata CBS 1993]|uniref:Skg3/CAF120-like PH-like domain-containing protein n=1 Tax=Kuraishia capsulata CBS 1993 TaxID=1382522 RepID=W6MXU1_9ASCO|nr:uncharacterized protein KUCA_T00005463001 [Kuraishia capsulata CBS 1993]CDK29475.1 unnamed protein product [Kuraishia capsulata CBS 1993]
MGLSKLWSFGKSKKSKQTTPGDKNKGTFTVNSFERTTPVQQQQQNLQYVRDQQNLQTHHKADSLPPQRSQEPQGPQGLTPPPAQFSRENSASPSRKSRPGSTIDSKRISSVPTSFLRQSTVLPARGQGGNYYHSSSPSQSSSGRGGLALTKGVNAALVSNPDVPAELVPIITLIHAQQARIYAETYLQIPCEDEVDGSKSWMVVTAKLSGTELTIWEVDEERPNEVVSDVDGSFKPIYINIVDANFSYMPTPQDPSGESFFDLAIHLTTTKSYLFRFGSADDLHYFYSALLLSQFEYRQLQESFTGALFSVKAVHFSDVRTLLDPSNRFVKSDWCIIRFPFLNNKWIRCYVSIIPGDKVSTKKSKIGKESKSKPGKVEIYTQKTNNKKFLLASVVNAKSCFSVYPENPSFINNNSLIRLSGDCFVNETLLSELISAKNPENLGGERSRSSSMGQRLTSKGSSSSLRMFNASGVTSPNANSNVNATANAHSRSSSLNKSRLTNRMRSPSMASLDSSNSSFSLTKKSKHKNLNVLNTHLCYIIPESHSGVPPVETMIRNLIPMMNVFRLYGRPLKFISDKSERTSMLFGLPQLPHTQYLDAENAYKLLDLNIGNSVAEDWNNFDWMQVFKEMVVFKLSKGWSGTGSVFDTFRDGLLYSKERQEEEDYYNAEDVKLEFVSFKDTESDAGPSSPTSPLRTSLSRPNSPFGLPNSPTIPSNLATARVLQPSTDEYNSLSPAFHGDHSGLYNLDDSGSWPSPKAATATAESSPTINSDDSESSYSSARDVGSKEAPVSARQTYKSLLQPFREPAITRPISNESLRKKQISLVVQAARDEDSEQNIYQVEGVKS